MSSDFVTDAVPTLIPGQNMYSSARVYHLLEVGQLNVLGPLQVTLTGAGLAVAEGTNAKQGKFTLVAGLATIPNITVTADSRIFLTNNGTTGSAGFLFVASRTVSTATGNFIVASSNVNDTSLVAYEIFEPATY